MSLEIRNAYPGEPSAFLFNVNYFDASWEPIMSLCLREVTLSEAMVCVEVWIHERERIACERLTMSSMMDAVMISVEVRHGQS